ncbi:MAG: dihydropteroate synthase, partial [Oleiharenicola lentus]
MSPRPLNIIGELINNSYARARTAFTERNPAAYAQLAKIQADLGVSYLTVNLDGTARIQVRMEEMLALLPD